MEIQRIEIVSYQNQRLLCLVSPDETYVFKLEHIEDSSTQGFRYNILGFSDNEEPIIKGRAGHIIQIKEEAATTGVIFNKIFIPASRTTITFNTFLRYGAKGVSVMPDYPVKGAHSLIMPIDGIMELSIS